MSHLEKCDKEKSCLEEKSIKRQGEQPFPVSSISTQVPLGWNEALGGNRGQAGESRRPKNRKSVDVAGEYSSHHRDQKTANHREGVKNNMSAMTQGGTIKRRVKVFLVVGAIHVMILHGKELERGRRGGTDTKVL